MKLLNKKSIITHKENGQIIPQQTQDGYVSATALCNAVGRKFSNYYRLPVTKEFLNELSQDLQLPIEGKNRT